MLMGAFGLVFFQDPLLNYFNTWSTYNTWMWNRGSWVLDIPGWMSWGKPGAMMAEPLLMNAPGYTWGVLICTMLGCWVMRRAKLRWPNLGVPGLLGVLVVWTFFFDLVIEGLFLMPMGLFTYPGAIRWLSHQSRHVLPVADLRRNHVGRRPGRVLLAPLLHGRSRPDLRRARPGARPGRGREEGVDALPGHLRGGQHVLLRVLQHSRPSGSRCTPTPGRRTSRSARTSRWASAAKGRGGSARIRPFPSTRVRPPPIIGPDGKVVLPEGVELPKIVPFDRAE